MLALRKEHARGAVQLGNNHPFCPIDDERSALGHIGDIAQEHFLLYGAEVFVVLIVAGKAQLGFEWDIVSQPPLYGFIHIVFGGVNRVINKLKYEVVSGIRDGEVLGKYLEKSLLLALFWWGVQLEKVLKRLQLDFQKIRVFEDFANFREVLPSVDKPCQSCWGFK